MRYVANARAAPRHGAAQRGRLSYRQPLSDQRRLVLPARAARLRRNRYRLVVRPGLLQQADGRRRAVYRTGPDRGPFAAGRIIDLSERAAKLLGIVQKGTARVRVQYVARADLPTGRPQPFGAGTPEAIQNAIPPVPSSKVETDALAPVPGVKIAPPKLAPALPSAQTPPPVMPDAGSLPTGQVTQVPVPAVTHLYVQLGAFSNYSNAARLAARLGPDAKISAIQRNGQTLYRVRSGPFATTDEADQALANLLNLGAADAHIVVDP